MNQKIKDLMLNAISLVDNISYDRDGDIHRMYIPNVFAEKFAELIIRECCMEMEDTDSFYGEWMSQVIKEHFGVE